MINFIGLIAVIYLFLNAEPIEWIRKFLMLSEETKAEKEWHTALITLFNCALCTGFWIGLYWYHSVMWAAMLSVAAEVFTVIMRKFNNTLR